MTVTRLGPPIPILNSGLGTTSSIPSGGTAGQIVTSNGSNGSYWGENVARITANGSNILLSPFVSVEAGSGIAFSVSSNALTISSTGGASGSFLETSGGGKGTLASLGTLGATETINIAAANYFYGTLDANCTIGFTGWTASKDSAITVELTENGTGGWTPTFSGVTWLGGTTPTHDTTIGSTTLYVFMSRDGGTTILGGQVGGSTSGATSPLTTKGDLYTYSTANTRLAVGSNAQFVVADPLETPGLRWTNNPAVGELLLSSTASKPPVFGDILTTTTEDDFVYGSR